MFWRLTVTLSEGKVEDYWNTLPGLKSRIDMIAGDFTFRVNNGATAFYGDANNAGLQWTGYLDFKTCDICEPRILAAEIDGKIYKTGQFIPRLPAHPRCLLPDTLVHTIRGLIPIKNVKLEDYVLSHKGIYRQVLQLHKQKYIGEIYGIGSNWLTGNHPVLTPKGFRRIDSINNLSDVLAIRPNSNRKRMTIKLENYVFPALFSQKRFLSTILSFSEIMPMPNIKLNSNLLFRNSKIKIISSKGKFTNHIYSAVNKNFEENLLHFRYRASFKSGFWNFNMRFRYLILSLFTGHLAPLNFFRFALVSNINLKFDKSTSDKGSTYFEKLGNFVFRPQFISIKRNNFISRDKNFDKSSFTIPISLHPSTPIKTIDIKQYEGYTYNLTVDKDHSYVIGKEMLIVGNCRCTWRLIPKGSLPTGSVVKTSPEEVSTDL